MKLEKLKNVEIKKSEMINVKGGTTSTEFTQTGYTESEQQLDPVSGKKIGDPVLVEFPDGN